MELILKKTSTVDHVRFAGLLIHAAAQFKIFHWQSTSTGVHLTFDEAYDVVQEGLDTFVETIQGKDGQLLINFPSSSFTNYNKEVALKYISDLKQKIVDYRTALPKVYEEVNNQLQELQNNLNKIHYKLKFLP